MAIASPFDAVYTSIVSPRFAKNFSVYLYKPDSARGEAKPYTLNVRPMYSTMGIHAHSYVSYQNALAYLSSIYGSAPQDEDEECVIWEVSGPMEEAEMQLHEVYETELQEHEEPEEPEEDYEEIWNSQK